jgi:uncharacterized membrane protein
VYICLCTFGFSIERQKILHRTTASIPRVQSALNFSMNATLICKGCSQISEMIHTFNQRILLPIFMLWHCSPFCSRDMAYTQPSRHLLLDQSPYQQLKMLLCFSLQYIHFHQ